MSDCHLKFMVMYTWIELEAKISSLFSFFYFDSRIIWILI